MTNMIYRYYRSISSPTSDTSDQSDYLNISKRKKDEINSALHTISEHLTHIISKFQ